MMWVGKEIKGCMEQWEMFGNFSYLKSIEKEVHELGLLTKKEAL